MGTMVDIGETDIDKFIRGHKNKLQHERNYLDAQQGPSPRSRKQWEKEQARDVRPAVQNTGPKQPEETGLKFNNDAQDRKKQQLQAERQQEYNDLIAKKFKTQAFDYKETQRAHLEEKKREYNRFLQEQRQLGGRYIDTPEKGLFIGPDQSERDRQIKERNLQFRKEIEKQQEQKLFHKFQAATYDPFLSPRRYEQQKLKEGLIKQRASKNYATPDQSPRKTAFRQGVVQEQNKRPPLFKENTPKDDLHLPLHRMEDKPREEGRQDVYGPPQGQGRSYVRDMDIGGFNEDDRESRKEKWYNDNKSSAPFGVRRSRSVSPPSHRDRVDLDELRRSLEEMDKQQQQLRAEHERGQVDPRQEAPGPSDRNRQKLDDERRREYQEYLEKLPKKNRDTGRLEGNAATLPVGEYDDNRKQQLLEERHNEYLQLQQQKLATQRQRGLPPKPPTPNHYFKTLGEHDRTAHVLNEERKKEYNQKMEKERLRTGAARRGGPDTGGAVLIDKSDSPALRKKRELNEEYNRYLEEKKVKDAHRLDHKKPPTAAAPRHGMPPSPKTSPRVEKNKDVFATLPGLKYSDSADKRKMQERNKEYNDYLKLKEGPRKGWATPTYEEILDQKRRDERLRRQEEDYENEPPRIRPYASEGAINKLEDEFRGRQLDKEYEARKVRFDDERRLQQNQGGILEDDNWLRPERREEEYHHLSEQPRVEQRDDMATRVTRPAQYQASLQVGGTENLGHDESGSAKRRRQADYRRELQLQMDEFRAAKKREKVQELRVNATGLLDPEKSSERMQGLTGGQGVSPRREYKSRDVQPYHTKFFLGRNDRNDPPLSNRNERIIQDDYSDVGDSFGGGYDPGYGAPEPRGRRRDRGGLFDTGLEGLLESRRQPGIVDVPPGLRYNASTYVTAGGLGTNGLGAGGQVDDAYHYYGMKNLLDTNDPGMNLGLNLGGGGGGGGGGGYRGSPTPRVTFADDSPPVSYRKRDRSGERISPYQFRSDDDTRSKSRTDTASYGAELERQIQEKRRQKQKEREDQQRYERKLEEDIKNYNPFGRGGGGAPIRDEGGNAIADLRAVQKGYSPRRVSPTYSPRPPSPRDDKIKPPPPQQTLQGENTYARGGHGIFGQPKTDAEKDVTDKYKDELRRQIEEKRRLQQLEKDREKQEEALENKRLEDQRKRMQEEYEEEQKKIRAREEEARRKNEELKQQAEERKRETERQRREADEKRMREQQEQLDRERQEKDNERADDQRGNSPPLPAHRAEDRGTPVNRPPRSRASVRSQQVSPHQAPVSDRPSSSDVLTQLASMRKQLQSERKRVENALENSKNEPEVFDPRLVQKAPQNKLIFENAVNKNASLPPPRAQTTDRANARALQQFNELKYKPNTDSRRQFRSMYQEAPVTNVTLETQQDAMLRQQAEQIKALKERNTYDPTPSTSLYHRPGNVSARSQLEANSAFIDVEGVNHFPEDFEDMPGARNDSARARRRDRFSPRGPSNLYMGSQTSLDVDSIQRKNEERLRRLRQVSAGDDISVTDPDDILDRFMSQQRYNRPPSGQTLQDDSWLRPGSKVI